MTDLMKCLRAQCDCEVMLGVMSIEVDDYNANEDRERARITCGHCKHEWHAVFAHRLDANGEPAWGPVDGAWHYSPRTIRTSRKAGMSFVGIAAIAALLGVAAGVPEPKPWPRCEKCGRQMEEIGPGGRERYVCACTKVVIARESFPERTMLRPMHEVLASTSGRYIVGVDPATLSRSERDAQAKRERKAAKRLRDAAARGSKP